eukprot:CAMPEP_0202957292 /NCGR_PEP_ID=MMETSP1396-20130829/1732_1 /ASSEMBLY_ACC=CAM_ASM_000872 /TAXON_ID= /ORGANISM="Pseudokeronopsis sp., Strain Brazil" /LENGTH=60 /DNA_ID=CAMNT_0049674717 /DNA_START=128 /DNA_END=307 /DNA_ORIENTATION=-
MDEKFQVTSIFEIGPDGRPKVDKPSTLTVFNKKEKKSLGEASLNLSDYHEDDEVNMRLSL